MNRMMEDDTDRKTGERNARNATGKDETIEMNRLAQNGSGRTI